MAWCQHRAVIRALEHEQGCRLLATRRAFNAARLAAGGDEQDRAAAREHRQIKRQHRAAARSGNPTAQAAYQFHRLAQQFFDPAQQPRPVQTRDVLGVLQQQQQQAMTSRNRAVIRRLNRLRQFLEDHPNMLPADAPPEQPDVCARLSAPPRPRKRTSRRHPSAEATAAPAEQGRCNPGFAQIACTDMTLHTPFDRSFDERVVQLSDKSCYTAEQLAAVHDSKLRPEELTRTWTNATMTTADQQAVVTLLAHSRDPSGRSYLEQAREGGWMLTSTARLPEQLVGPPTAFLLLPDGRMLISLASTMHQLTRQGHARIVAPHSAAHLLLLADGSVLWTDQQHHCIRLLSNKPRSRDMQVSTVAGDAQMGHRDGAAGQAQFRHPSGLAVLPDGQRVLVADSGNHRIRLLDLVDRQVSTVAGSGDPGHRDGAALAAQLNAPDSLAVLPDGNRVLITDRNNHRIRMLDLTTLQLSTVAGNGKKGHRDGAALQAQFDALESLAVLPEGTVAVVDRGTFRVLSADLQQVSTPEVFRHQDAECLRDRSSWAPCLAVSPTGALLASIMTSNQTGIYALGGWFDDSVAMCQRRQARDRAEQERIVADEEEEVAALDDALDADEEEEEEDVVRNLAELTALPPADLEAQLPRFWELMQTAYRKNLELRDYPEIHMSRPIAVALWRLAVGPERELDWDEIESRLLPQVEDLSRAWTTDMLEYSEDGEPDQLLRDLVDPDTAEDAANHVGPSHTDQDIEQQQFAWALHDAVLELQG